MKGATPSGTRSFFERQTHPLQHRPLGKTGLEISPVGFGGYRVTDDNAAHHEALRTSLLAGCNLIDTSSNYGNGGSELLIGDVLDELLRSQRLKREEVVIVSKAGYVQGDNLALARERLAQGKPFPEMVEYDSHCWHCISPEFLEDQITRSLGRLQLDQLDIFLLHNPEYFLETSQDHAEYYRRIACAFEHLENEVKRGRIQFYGISSNTFPLARDAEKYTSLESVYDLAQTAKNTHFAVIQFPLNLFEPGAALEENNSGKTVLEFAREKNLGTLVNRPLNSFRDGKLVRLTDFPPHDGEDIAGGLKAAWARAMELEALIPSSTIAWGHVLKKNFNHIVEQEIEAWKHLVEQQIRPSLEEIFARTRDDSTLTEWGKDYRATCLQLVEAFTAYLENQASYQSDLLSAKLDHACPALHATEALSQKVVRLYLSLPGLDCVLVGMRQSEYVRDLLRTYEQIPPKDAQQALLAVQAFTATPPEQAR